MTKIFSPFHLTLSPMKHLMLINIDKDTDDVYIGFEPQIFDDEINGKGIRILCYRKDGFVDLYHEEQLSGDDEIKVAGKGKGDSKQIELTKKLFDISSLGIKLHLEFIDKLNRKIELKIIENSRKKAKFFDLLAPIGLSSKNPDFFPAFFLYDFYFVRRKNSTTLVCIDGRNHQLDTMPFPMGREFVYFSRYSRVPMLYEFNKNYEGELKEINVGGKKSIDTPHYNVIDGNINEMSIGEKENELKVSFNPPIKNILDINPSEKYDGKFTISGRPSIGTISGEYAIHHNCENIEITLTPSEGWMPKENRIMVKFIYSVTKIFQTWPKGYKWTSIITFRDGIPYMSSKWANRTD